MRQLLDHPLAVPQIGMAAQWSHEPCCRLLERETLQDAVAVIEYHHCRGALHARNRDRLFARVELNASRDVTRLSPDADRERHAEHRWHRELETGAVGFERVLLGL